MQNEAEHADARRARRSNSNLLLLQALFTGYPIGRVPNHRRDHAATYQRSKNGKRFVRDPTRTTHARTFRAAAAVRFAAGSLLGTPGRHEE